MKKPRSWSYICKNWIIFLLSLIVITNLVITVYEVIDDPKSIAKIGIFTAENTAIIGVFSWVIKFLLEHQRQRDKDKAKDKGGENEK